MSAVDVSLIIPTRNRPLQLARLVGSFLSQAGAKKICRLEIIVVDDGSLPDIHRKNEELARGHSPLVKLVSNPAPVGPGGARNRGADLSRGDVLAFLDDDMVPCPTFLCNLIRFHREHPDILVANGNLKLYRRNIYTDFWFYYYSARFNISTAEWYPVPRISSGNFSIKRSLLRAVGPLFDPNFASWEDFDLAVRLRERGIPIYKVDGLIAYHDGRSNLRDFLEGKAWFAAGKAQVLQKHGPTVLAEIEAGSAVPRKLKFLPLYAAQRLSRWRRARRADPKAGLEDDR